jgi:hypothetical protein
LLVRQLTELWVRSRDTAATTALVAALSFAISARFLEHL